MKNTSAKSRLVFEYLCLGSDFFLDIFLGYRAECSVYVRFRRNGWCSSIFVFFQVWYSV